MTPPIRVRFAPSPTGYLHIGGARTALFNWLFARREGGVFLLRIEDTDVERSSEAMVEGILESMRWLGLNWDEGPFFQSQRLDLYRENARRLQESGHAYRCYCSPEELNARRKEAEAARRPWKYEGRCRELSSEERCRREGEGTPFVVRFRVPAAGTTAFADEVHGAVEFGNAEIEDFVLLRSDGFPTYHLSVVSDDIDMRISHVIRGDDHLSNTPKQILIYQALGRPLPAFAHVPLILGPDRSRLSKRHGATAVGAYSEQGILPEAMLNFLALLGWSPGDDREVLRVAELIEAFSFQGISKSAAVFDLKKLEWFNSEYFQRMTAAELEPHIAQQLRAAGCWNPEWADEQRAWFLRTLDLLKARLRTLKDVTGSFLAFFRDEFPVDVAAAEKFWKEPRLPEWLAEMAADLEKLEPFDAAHVEVTLRSLAERKAVKAGVLINASRVALTGQGVAPSLFDVMEVLGKQRTVARLHAAAARLISATEQKPSG